jgi:hypothetical protein
MMREEYVVEWAEAYIENPDTDRLNICAGLAIIQIRKWLIDPAFEEESESFMFLCLAAAALAYYYYVLEQVQKQPAGDFSANGVSVKTNFEEELKKAKLLVNEQLQIVSHLIKVPTSGFAFLNVEER